MKSGVVFRGFAPLLPTDPPQCGSYRLHGRLGAGGMGQVYLAFLPGGRPVALKCVYPELAQDREFRRRFEAEVRAAQRVNGLHIAPLIEADVKAQVPWLLTAYVPGPSLQETVAEHGPLPPASLRRLLLDIAHALQTIHGAGLVHRDLKPANVILADDGPKVIDFGVVRAADGTSAALTSSNRIGTPQYMAPEQIEGQSATPALDVFALGSLMFFAATGRSAFGEGDAWSMIYGIMHKQPELDGCPPELRDLLARCLDKDPAGRPTPEQLVEAVHRDAGPTPRAAGEWLPAVHAREVRARVSAVGQLGKALNPPQPSAPPQWGGTSGPVGGPRPGVGPLVGGTPPPRRRRRSLGKLMAKYTAIIVASGIGVVVLLVVGVLFLGSLLDPATHGGGSGATYVPPSYAPTTGTGAASQSASAPATGPAPSPSKAPTATVIYRNAMALDKDDFDVMPPVDNDSTPSVVADTNDVSNTTTVDGYSLFATPLGLWTGSGTPTESQCQALIASQGQYSLQVSTGSRVCVLTQAGRYAYMDLTSFNNAYQEYMVNVVVWSSTS